MRAGDLRHTIVIEQKGATLDSFGGESTTWSTVKTMYGEVMPLSGREREAAQAIHPDISHQVTVRYQPLFANPVSVANMRLRFGSRIFNILAPLNVDERGEWVQIMASEGMAVAG